MNERIEVQTVFGKLVAEKINEPYPPGIYLCLEDDKSKKVLALIDCHPKRPVTGEYTLRGLIWNDPQNIYPDVTNFKHWPAKGEN